MSSDLALKQALMDRVFADVIIEPFLLVSVIALGFLVMAIGEVFDRRKC